MKWKLIILGLVTLMIIGCNKPKESTQQEVLPKDVIEATENRPVDKADKLQAFEEAKAHLSETSYSKKTLIGRLEHDGYSQSVAEEVVEELAIDWKNQAELAAKKYLTYSSFSEPGLLNQLQADGFTEEEARQAMTALAVDWKEQAVKIAKVYLEVSSFSKDGLIEQLELAGFSTEQATFGAKENGFD